MFSLMANCFQWLKARREPAKKVTLVLIGLDNAGKTTTVLGIQGESQEEVPPTVGFSSSNFKFEKFDVTVFDLGGGKKIRPIWKNYYAEIHGVVFVIDASDESRLRECQEVLQEVLKEERVCGKRILILANKQDKEGALDEIDLCDQLNLEKMVNGCKCPCRVETCSAVQGIGKKMDQSVSLGLQWLLHGILGDWVPLSARVAREVADQKEVEAIEKKAKTERIRKRREEREHKAEEERKRLGLETPPVEDEEDVIMGDPFKPVNKDYFKKDEKSKKKNNKVELEKLNNNQSATTKDAEGTEQPHDEHTNMDPSISQSVSGERSAEAGSRLSGASPEQARSRDNEDDMREEGRHKGADEAVAMALEQTEEVIPQEKKKKKKKKLKKKNKLAPLPLDGDSEGLSPPLGIPSWASAVNQRPLTRPPHQPTLDPLPERASPRLDPIESKTSLNDQKLTGIPSTWTQPNFEQEDNVIT